MGKVGVWEKATVNPINIGTQAGVRGMRLCHLPLGLTLWGLAHGWLVPTVHIHAGSLPLPILPAKEPHLTAGKVALPLKGRGCVRTDLAAAST